jgi:hypothetical protein
MGAPAPPLAPAPQNAPNLHGPGRRGKEASNRNRLIAIASASVALVAIAAMVIAVALIGGKDDDTVAHGPHRDDALKDVPVEPSGGMNGQTAAAADSRPTERTSTPDAEDVLGSGEPVTFTGEGTKVVPFTSPVGPDKPWLLTVDFKSNSDYGRIAVFGLNAEGKTEDFGAYGGNSGGAYLMGTYTDSEITSLQVEADGSWTITAAPLTEARTWDGSSPLAGEGNEVILVPGGLKSPLVTDIVLTTGSLLDFFSVSFLGVEDYAPDELTTIGSGSAGETMIPAGTQVIEVDAMRSWSMSPTI